MIKVEEEDLDAIFENITIFIRLLQNRKVEFTEEENKIAKEIEEDINNHSQLRSLMSTRKFIFDLYKQAEAASVNQSEASETAAKVYQEYLICTKELEEQKAIIIEKRILRKKRMEELLSNLLGEKEALTIDIGEEI